MILSFSETFGQDKQRCQVTQLTDKRSYVDKTGWVVCNRYIKLRTDHIKFTLVTQMRLTIKFFHFKKKNEQCSNMYSKKRIHVDLPCSFFLFP
jgi:hypothetical protein